MVCECQKWSFFEIKKANFAKNISKKIEFRKKKNPFGNALSYHNECN